MATPLPPSAGISIRDYFYPIPYHPLPPGTPVPYSTGVPDVNPLNLSPTPFEPTSTLVLTSPTGTFVDLRVLRPILPGEAELPNEPGSSHRLQWAFAGKSSSFAIEGAAPIGRRRHDGEEGEVFPTHSVWSHWVDSKFPVGSPDVPVDEGDMYPMPDGRTLEHGFSFNEGFGRNTSYEEMWSDVDIAPCGNEDMAVIVVLRIQKDASNIRGVIVRVGQYCQGLLKHGDTTTAERWEFDETGGKWKRTVKIGSLFLPCAAAFKPEDLAVGAKVSFTDYHWFVEELVEVHGD
ncbi:hypothetical protein K504DRAFT_373322 [Pleomassaria siparia CBS 279.74]|uniref:Protein HRI1 n=1 Tax=Pleomassaria siparia CBS 279.74 TaxID=1314801 RepID=A0A6G1KHB9_9PLEO|nr:hypothetical protein K504DRAFT_373322 [Pleomassaria siparia CBS 279.74]